MLTRRLVLASNRLLGEQISSIFHLHEGSIAFAICAKTFNTHFYIGNVAARPVEYHSSCMYNDKIKSPCKTAVNKRRNALIRFYSGDPSVMFLSGGKSTHFEDHAVYDKDKLLNKVIDQLKEDNGVDISVIETSEERRKYADYVVVVSGRSTRHLKAMTNHIHQQVFISLQLKSAAVC